MKNLLILFSILTVLIAKDALADTTSTTTAPAEPASAATSEKPAATKITTVNKIADPHTILTIRFYSEPKDRDLSLSYQVTLPKDEYYSYYLGSDLPVWKFSNNQIAQGQFRSIELVNLRVHSKQNKPSDACKTVHLTLNDDEQARIIWKGKIIYGCPNKTISVVADTENQKYYLSDIKIDNTEKNVFFETTER